MRKKVLALGLTVLAVIVLWTAGWLWASGEIKRQIGLLAEADGETAPQLTCGALDVGGFPFRFDIECRDARLLDQDVTVGAAGLKASVLTYNPTHVVFSALAPMTLANAFTGSQSRIDFTGLEGSARVTTSDFFKGLSGAGWRIARVSVVADGVAWNETVLKDLLQLQAGHVEAHLIDIPEQHDRAAGTAALAAYAQVKDLVVPALKIAQGSATFDAELSGLPDDLNAFADPELMRNWQRRGGKLKLASFSGSQPQPDESFDISGELTLTDTGLPQGQLTYKTKGVLDRFEGMMPPLQLAAFKGRPEADGSFSNTLNIVDGQVRLLAFPLADLAPLF